MSVSLAIAVTDERSEIEISVSTLETYLQQHLNYPELAIEYGIEGAVKLNITLTPDGQMIRLKVLESIGFGCEEEAIRLIHEMENWEGFIPPNSTKSHEVQLSIEFRLQ